MTGKPTIVQLEYIVAVDNYRHFATAAEKCFVTQPTLSMQIQKLEDQLGISIFDRSKQPVKPTLAGERILDQARRVLHETYRINDIIEEEKGEVRGELRIGIIPTIAPYLLPKFIATFAKKFPEVHVHMEELITDQIIEKLNKELLDVGIVVTPLNERHLYEQRLYNEAFLGYVSANSGMSKMSKISFKQLKDEQMWILNEGHCFREQVLNICDLQNGADYDSSFSYESGSLESIKRLVDVYGGVTLLPELAKFDMHKSDLAKIRPFKAPVPTREVSLVTQRNLLKKKLIDALRKEIINGIPESIKTRKAENVVKWR
jgi:LysR family hydrogen peroxide-inducible transcriptional activator